MQLSCATIALEPGLIRTPKGVLKSVREDQGVTAEHTRLECLLQMGLVLAVASYFGAFSGRMG